MKIENPDYSFVIFPYLKTRNDVTIGKIEFRSTDNTDGLNQTQKEELQNITNMLFLQNDLRIKNASYALVNSINIENTESLQPLKDIRNFVAYCYLGPRHEFCDIFFSTEKSSMVILSPGRVIKSLVFPSNNVENISSIETEAGDVRGSIQGFSGLFDFKHYFWVTKDSRIYGPKPHITLNIAQDLENDIKQCVEARCDYRLLYNYLIKPKTKTLERFLIALQWFNSANDASNDNASALVDLSIAFESLLNLPADNKTDRLIDAISMLLGRITRLDVWVKQFYDARSKIVHEGINEQTRFIATDSPKKSAGNQYQSLLSYGRHIFQLCFGTLLTGLNLSIESKLEQKFVTNEERFQEICDILSNDDITLEERFNGICQILSAIEHYRYIPESNLKIYTLIHVTSIAAKTILKNLTDLPSDLSKMLSVFNEKKPSKSFLVELETVSRLEEVLKCNRPDLKNSIIESFRDLIRIIWSYVFMHYYWLKENKK